jgi:DNA-binding transcriptional LysR family regulator
MMRDRVREAYAGLDAALKSVLDTADSPKGKITVTAPADFAGTILCEALARFYRHCPQVEVDVRLSSNYVDLVASNVDVAIRFASRQLKDSSLRAKKLARVTVGMFAARSYIEARGMPRDLEDAKHHAWIALRHLHAVPLRGPDGPVRWSMPPRIVCDEVSFTSDAIFSGLGLGLLPCFLAESGLRDGRLVQVLTRYSIDPMSMWFITHAGVRRAQVTDGLRAALVDVMSARPSVFLMGS